MFRGLALTKSIARPYKLYNISLYPYSLINIRQLEIVGSYCEKFLLRSSCSLKVRMFPWQLGFVRSCSINFDQPTELILLDYYLYDQRYLRMVWKFNSDGVIFQSFSDRWERCCTNQCYGTRIMKDQNVYVLWSLLLQTSDHRTRVWRNNFGISRSNIVPQDVDNAH